MTPIAELDVVHFLKQFGDDDVHDGCRLAYAGMSRKGQGGMTMTAPTDHQGMMAGPKALDAAPKK